MIALGGIGVGAYVSAQNDPVNQVLQAQDVQKKSAPVPGGGTATISASSAKDSFVVLMDGGVAPAPEGKVYQLWTLPKDGSAPCTAGNHGCGDALQASRCKGPVLSLVRSHHRGTHWRIKRPHHGPGPGGGGSAPDT